MYEIKTNLTGWTTAGADWTPTSVGWKGTAPANQNGYAMSATQADNFTYEADILVQDTYAIGTLLFRSDAAGTNAYALQVDPNSQQLRLYKTNGNVTLGTKTVPIVSGAAYHFKVKAEGSSIKVYWQPSYLNAKGYDPVISVTDTSYAGGYAGLGVYNGTVLFQNMTISSLDTNLQGWTAAGGTWKPDLKGIKAASTGANDTFRMSLNTASDFVLEGILTVDAATPQGTAALVFRSNAGATAGYVFNIDPTQGQVRLFDINGGRTIASASKTITPGKPYHVEIVAKGSQIVVYLDGYATPVISAADTAYTSGAVGLNAYNGTAYFQNVYVTALSEYDNEMYRPQYHYTQQRSYASDPNGLVYFNGEYHFFHQDAGRWAHAVSTDLVHWKRLPIALPFNDMGHTWTGSAVVDEHDVSGLFNGGSGLIAYFTSYNPDKPNGNQKVGAAYSTDSGRTWQLYSGNPVVPNPGADGGWDFRDPKVVWDADHSKWIMVISGGDHIRFYTSTNLLTWTFASSFGYGDYLHGGVWECPDLFQLPVDGDTGNKKWVLIISTGAVPQTNGSSSEYFVGSFDGTTFTSDNPAATVLRSESGADMYAAMTFDGIPAADGRRISIGWMSNWNYPFSFPTSPWKGQMSVPRVLSLKTVAGQGVRLTEMPIAELQTLHQGANVWNDVTVSPSSANLLSSLSGTAYEIEAELELPASNPATEFGFRLRELGDQKTVVGYNVSTAKMFVDRTDAGVDNFTEQFLPRQEAALAPESGRVKMRIFVDEASVEAFGNDGKAVISDVIFPDAARDGMSFYATGGDVKVVSLTVYSMSNVWNQGPVSGSSPQKVVMGQSSLELAPGAVQRLYSMVLPRTASNKTVTWSSSNTAVASVASADARSADVTAVAPGLAVITATTQDGGIVGSTIVRVGSFRTNLTGFAPVPNGRWAVTADGIAGTFDKDSNYMSQVTGSNFTYEADVKLDTAGGAGSMIYRASADGSSGYYLNVDPNLKAIRLFYKLNGSFTDSQMLANIPIMIQAGKTYHVKIVTSGTNMKVYVDDNPNPVIDLNDSTFSQGYFGVNVFGGTAYYQDVNVTS
ncbi:hypothetical protein VN24_03630 [Paenibacillus beijingensis]|uniref:BIG2 domain-containing protein n=1 Tax=Paenibacillus beijingensis TaxID=1126833 RepID=A0A0D5NQ78_9BACL|nr:hypothetical protein VN24_03630 [Paenibacillus beijingensis]